MLLLSASASRAGEAAMLSLGGKVFSPGTTSVTASFTTTSADKVRAEFVWLEPGGREHSRRAKLGFPKGGKDHSVTVTDAVSPGGIEGWWTVRVLSGQEAYETEFLVTSDGPLLGFAAGGKEKKLEILGGPGVTADLETVALEDPDEDVRMAAVSASTGIGEDVWRGVIDRALADGSAGVRLAAVETFASSGADCSAYRDRLLDDPVDYVRAAYADYLGSVRPPGAMEALGELIDDVSANVRARVLSTLEAWDDPDTVNVLVKGFKVPDPEFSMKLIEVLVAKDPQGLDGILADRLSDQYPAVRTAAMDELEGMSGWDTSRARPLLLMDDGLLAERALGIFIDGEDKGALRFALGSPHASVRRDALDALRDIGGDAYTGALGIAATDPDSTIALDSVKRLAELGQNGRPGLITALGAPDGEVREVAARALLASPDPSEEAAMTALLDDPIPSLRACGLTYLDKIDSAGLSGYVGKAAADTSPEVRSAAVAIAGRRVSEEYSRVLSDLYGNGDASDRYMAARQLAQRDDPHAVRVMVEALNDPDDRVRLVAVRYVREKDPARLPIELAADSDQDIRSEALKGLARNPSAGTEAALVDIVTDANPANRKLALDILGGIEGAAAGRLISRLVDDVSPEVRKSARELVYSRPDAGVVNGLIRLGGAGDPEAVDRAVRALDGHPCPDLEVHLQQLAVSPAAAFRLFALEKSVSCGSPGLAGLAGTLLDDSAYNVRMAAVVALSGSGGTDAGPVLVRALGDADGRVRYAALVALVDRHSEAYARLLPGLVRDPDEDVAGLATSEAVRLGDTVSLVAAAQGPHRGYARDALDALLPTGDPRALGVFAEYFRQEYRRKEMVAAMTRVAGTAPLEPLSEAYGLSGDDTPLRVAVIAGLAGRGPEAADTLIQAFDDPAERVRLAAVDAASTIDDPAVKRRLMARALEDVSLRDSVLESMSKSPDDMQALAELSVGAGEEFRLEVVEALVESGAGVDAVLLFADDESTDVRKVVVKRLANEPGEVAVYGLLTAGADEGVRDAVQKALSGRPAGDVSGAVDMMFGSAIPAAGSVSLVSESVSDPGVLEKLVDRIGRRDCGLLGAAVEPMLRGAGEYRAGALTAAMGRCGRPLDLRIIDALSRMDDSGAALADAFDRHPGYGLDLLNAAYAAGKQSALLGRAVGGGDPAARRRAFEILDDPASPATAQYIEKGLRDGEGSVRTGAVEAAVRLGKEDILVQTANDTRPEVRLSVVPGLARLSSPEGYGALANLVPDGDDGVSRSATDALASAEQGAVPADIWRGLATAPGTPERARLTAVDRIAANPDPADAGLLAGMLSGYGDDISKRAAEGLAGIGVPSLKYVHPLLGDEDAFSRALDVVTAVSDPSSAPVLSGLLGNAGGRRRLMLISALGEIGGGEAVDALCAEYESGGADIKAAALKALAGSGADGNGRRVTAVVWDALSSPDETVRFYGAHTAGSLGMTTLKSEIEGLIEREKSAVVKKKLEDAKGAIDAASPGN